MIIELFFRVPEDANSIDFSEALVYLFRLSSQDLQTQNKNAI